LGLGCVRPIGVVRAVSFSTVWFLGRRVKAHIDSQSPAAPDGIDLYRHFYYNNAWQILETRTSAAENTEPEGLQPEEQYVWS